MKRNKLALSASLLSLALLIVSLFLCLTACSPKNLLPMTDEKGNFAYHVIRSDTAGSDVLNASVDINQALAAIWGVEPVIGTDWVHPSTGVADHPEIATEVLVGRTNRAESQAVFDELKEHEYTVRVVGQKIVVLGKNEFTTALAADYFIQTYLSGKNAGEIPADLNQTMEADYMYTYSLAGSGAAQYDEALTAATLQGLYNRTAQHKLYLLASNIPATSKALSLLSADGYRFSNIDRVRIEKFDQLLTKLGDCVEAVVIWDFDVPATSNVATTVAGAENGIVMNGNQYEQYAHLLPSDVKVIDLRGKFNSGNKTGSAKNDAYRWAIEEYLAKGRCSLDYLCSFEDAYYAREDGRIGYAVCRDAAIYYGAFVFDLSVWQDELPKDDMEQRMGLDYETYCLILKTVQELRGNEKLTEIMGFFPSIKYTKTGNDDTFTSKYVGTQFEWACSHVFTPYGCYWNPVTEYACNVTIHNDHQLQTPLKQNRPTENISLSQDEKDLYLLLVMGDYDSTGSVYTKMISNWDTNQRGTLPLAWSINPNLIEHYPDIMEYFYNTATENDYFVSNVGAAGWFAPSRVPDDLWDAHLAHHTKYFTMTDMSVAPDIWDFQTLSPLAESYITKFATTGVGTLVSNQLNLGTGLPTVPHVAENGSVIDALCNTFDREDPEACARGWLAAIQDRDRTDSPTFMSVRCVWSTPAYLNQCVNELKELLPQRNIHVVDPYTYYRLLGESINK